MRKKNRIFLIIPIGFILAVALFFGFTFMVAFLDTNNYYFESYSDAENESQGFVNNNWPDQVSKAVTNIYAQSHIDVYNVWMRFEVERYDADAMVSGLNQLRDEEIKELSVSQPWRVDWWFDGLVQQADHPDNSIDADIYVDVNGCKTTHTAKDAYIALEKNSTTGYYWCGGIKEQETTSQ